MRYLVRLGLPIWALILIGSPPTVGADIIRTLEATSGTLQQYQDSAFGSGVSGPGFNLGGFTPLIGFALPPVTNLHPSPGQLIDQSGQLILSAPLASINGHQCCGMVGTLNISTIPSLPMAGGGPPTLEVTAPSLLAAS